jgi:hypothetical protein
MENLEFLFAKENLAMLLYHRQRNGSSVEPSTEEYCGNELVTISIVFIFVNTIMVILRFYARSITKASYGWDDCLVFASFVVNITLCVVSICTCTILYLPLSLHHKFASHGELTKLLNHRHCLLWWRGTPYIGYPQGRPRLVS